MRNADIIAFLRWYMERNKLTQSRLAVQLGTSQAIVSRWFKRHAISDLWVFCIRTKLASQWEAFSDEVTSTPTES
jgi:predicted transcriptional regulator